MINAVVVQLYLLWKPFWQKIFQQEWSSTQTQIVIDINDFTAASYSVASILIAFGGVLGRVGPLDLLVIGLIGIAGYTLNNEIVYGQMKVLDAGGTTTIHVYGAYYGLVISAVLTKMKRTVRGPSSSNHSKVIMVFGTFFLWMFWPSFNANYFPTTPQERSLIIANTIYSLVGSCMSAFIINSFFRERFEIRNIMNSALAGGVVIGASSGLITTPTASISIGIGIGTVCTIGYRKLGPKLKNFLGLQDTCGINNLHGIPGIIGGIVSAIVLGAYNLSPLDEDKQSYLPFSKLNSERTYTQQAAYQIGGTGCSLALGLISGLIAALILSCFYNNKSENFFQDSPNFQIPSEDQKQKFLQTQFM